MQRSTFLFVVCVFSLAAEAESFKVRNEGNNAALVQIRRGESATCEAMGRHGEGPISAGSARTWPCDRGERICFRYKKRGAKEWSRWHADSCKQRANAGHFF